MKSENDLKITGTIVSDVAPTPGQNYVRFRIAHNFGGGRETLFLTCVLIIKPGMEIPALRRGASIRVHAYLSSRKGKYEAVLKSFTVSE